MFICLTTAATILPPTGLSGYEVLAATDPVFQPFGSSLFGRSSHDLQRAVETREINERLDVEIEKFLLLLCPYLEKEASLRALEWLVYRWVEAHHVACTSGTPAQFVCVQVC